MVVDPDSEFSSSLGKAGSLIEDKLFCGGKKGGAGHIGETVIQIIDQKAQVLKNGW